MTDPYQSLLNAGFLFVSFRPRSEHEFRTYLTRKMRKWNLKDSDLFEKVINRLKELGYIDDRKFVVWWASERLIHRPKGSRIIKQELLVKGIDTELISSLDQGEKPYDEKQGARVVLEKKMIRFNHLSPREKKQKMYEFLARRGFSSNTISRVIDELVGKRV